MWKENDQLLVSFWIHIQKYSHSVWLNLIMNYMYKIPCILWLSDFYHPLDQVGQNYIVQSMIRKRVRD